LANEPDARLTGAAFELANAGYVPMSDPDKRNDDDETIGSDAASLREAAEQRATTPREVTPRQYIDRSGEPVAQNEAITLERAARDYAAATSAERLLSENQSSEALAARVDAMRAEALAKDPDAAEFFGFELPEAKANRSKPETPPSAETATSGTASAEGLDAELAKALQHPQVAQAVEERLGEAEKVRQNYIDGLAAAQQVAQMSILSQIPELIGIRPENVQAAFAEIARRDPARFARVQGLVANTQQMFAQQQQEHQRQAEIARQNFKTFAKSEDTRLETMLKDEPKETQRAVTAEIFASAKESGVQPAELIRLLNSEPLMRNAVFQRMMYDAGKYRLMTKARDVAAAKALPLVQRPGMARNSAERNTADLRVLSAKLSSSGDIKDAVALYNARKSSRR
jgi:hypothetical protein